MTSLIILLFLCSRYCCHPSVMYFFPLKQQDFFLLVVIIVGNWKLFILPFHQHLFYFTTKSVLLFLKVDSVCSFQAILFVSCFCSDISVQNDREKTKCRFDRYLEHFSYSVTSPILFFFLTFPLLVTVVLGNLCCFLFLFKIPSVFVLFSLLFLAVDHGK